MKRTTGEQTKKVIILARTINQNEDDDNAYGYLVINEQGLDALLRFRAGLADLKGLRSAEFYLGANGIDFTLLGCGENDLPAMLMNVGELSGDGIQPARPVRTIKQLDGDVFALDSELPADFLAAHRPDFKTENSTVSLTADSKEVRFYRDYAYVEGGVKLPLLDTGEIEALFAENGERQSING